jgi:cytochrome P450
VRAVTDLWNDRFQPERWFNPNREMKDAFLPFGGGSRGKSDYFQT